MHILKLYNPSNLNMESNDMVGTISIWCQTLLRDFPNSFLWPLEKKKKGIAVKEAYGHRNDYWKGCFDNQIDHRKVELV